MEGKGRKQFLEAVAENPLIIEHARMYHMIMTW